MNPMCETFTAGQDLSAKQYYFVSIATDAQIDPTGDGALANGILQNKPDAAGKAATVAYAGFSKITAGAAFDEGILLSADASGKANTATSGDYILARAVQQIVTHDHHHQDAADLTTARRPFTVASFLPASMMPSNIAGSSAFILSARTSRTSAMPSEIDIETRCSMRNPPRLIACRFTERPWRDLVNRPINRQFRGWKRCSTISLSPGGASS